MRLTLVTPPAAEPLNTAEVETYLRGPATADNALVVALIKGAREAFERETGRQLVQAVWRGYLDAFPYCLDPIEVAKPPLVSVASITYIDTAGVLQVWAPAEYTVTKFTGPDALRGHIYPAPLKSYPATLRIPNAVTVEFTAGYGTSADLPLEIKQQLLAWVLDRYDNRETTAIGESASVFPGRGFGSWVNMGFG